MEDPALVKYFGELIGKLKEKGHSDGQIRASFHEAAPRLVWQERAYLAIVDSAAIFFGISSVFMIMLLSFFFPDAIHLFGLSLLLLFPGALLYYFAIGAFKFHAGEKLLMSAVIAAFLSAFAWLFDKMLTKLFDPLVATLQEKIAMLPPSETLAMLPGAAPLSGITQTGFGLLSIFGRSRIALGTMILYITVMYTLVPLVFFIVEKVRLHTAAKKS